jgi:hypothetical protein
MVRFAIVTPRTFPPTQIPNGTPPSVAAVIPLPTSTTSLRLAVSPRTPTCVNVPFM